MIINQITLYLLIVLTAALLVRGFWRHEDMLRFPFLAAAITAGWFIPQAIGLSENDSLPEGGFALTMLVAILSLGATVLGERAVQDRPPATLQEYNERTLLVASMILSAIGIVAQFLILGTVRATLAEGGDIGGQATGIVTIYFFFAEFQYYGLAIAILLLLRSFSWISFSIVAICIFLIGSVVIFGGRRGPATELGLIIASAFWFQRRMLPPRMLVVGVLVAATLLINSIQSYRNLMSTVAANSTEARLPTISELMELDFIGTMDSEVKSGSYEVTNAIYDIAATAQSANFDFGLVYWDYFVFRYIPAQIVGKDIKDTLMVTSTKDKWNNAWEVFQYKPMIGTTSHGIFRFVLLISGSSALWFSEL